MLYEREFRRKMLTYEEEMAKYQKQQQAKEGKCYMRENSEEKC